MPPLYAHSSAVQQTIQPPRFLHTSITIPQIVPTSAPLRQSTVTDALNPSEQPVNLAKPMFIPPIPHGVENIQMSPPLNVIGRESVEQEDNNERGERVCITQSCSTANSGFRSSSGMCSLSR